jgi:uncharacterized damage-inducible protein DinB
MTMRTRDLLRAQYRQAHGILEQVIEDCSEEVWTHVAGGTVGSIAAIYAHVVYDEDGMMRGAGRDGTVWESGGWAQKTGLGEMSPMQTQEWAQSLLDYDLAALREYAQAVYASTDTYLENLSDDDLAEEIETFAGKQPRARYLGTTCLWHITNHQGEISALKGVQGLKGLPF